MKSSLLSVLAASPVALAAVRGFNYGSQTHTYDSFLRQFNTAAELEGANDYTSARLYTMIQEGTTNTPISAIQAAIETKSTLLLGLWASVDQQAFNNEITALKNAIQQYGTQFADLVVGISVGSEDLYRISPIGIAAESGYGQTPDILVDYIGQVREAIRGTSLGSKPVGHVDTWNVYVNNSNSAVIAACDFLGLDEYPYFQTTDENEIGNAKTLFFEAYDKVAAVSGGKDIWITEAGWPVSGPKSNLAVANIENAGIFWQDVACELERRNINTWWYILADGGASPSFGVSEDGKPLYNLDCSASTSNSSSTSSSGASPSGSHGATVFHGTATEIATATGSPSVVATTRPTGTGSSGESANTNGGASTLATVTQSVGSDGSSTGSASGPNFTGAAIKLDNSMAGVLMCAFIAALAV